MSSTPEAFGPPPPLRNEEAVVAAESAETVSQGVLSKFRDNFRRHPVIHSILLGTTLFVAAASVRSTWNTFEAERQNAASTDRAYIQFSRAALGDVLFEEGILLDSLTGDISMLDNREDNFMHVDVRQIEHGYVPTLEVLYFIRAAKSARFDVYGVPKNELTAETEPLLRDVPEEVAADFIIAWTEVFIKSEQE